MKVQTTVALIAALALAMSSTACKSGESPATSAESTPKAASEDPADGEESGEDASDGDEHDEAQVRIDASAIHFQGEPVSELVDGDLANRGGPPLVRSLAKAWQDEQQPGHDDSASRLQVDSLTLYRPFTGVLFTGGQSGIKSFEIEIVDPAETSTKTSFETTLQTLGSPRMGPGAESDDDDDSQPLRLTLSVRVDGIDIVALGNKLEPAERCDDTGPTICHVDGAGDVDALLAQAHEAYLAGDDARATGVLEQIVDAYDFEALTAVLSGLAEQHADEEHVMIMAATDIPMGLVGRVVEAARGADRSWFDAPAFGIMPP